MCKFCTILFARSVKTQLSQNLRQLPMMVKFTKSRSTINEHILNAFSEKELEKSQSVRKIGN